MMIHFIPIGWTNSCGRGYSFLTIFTYMNMRISSSYALLRNIFTLQYTSLGTYSTFSFSLHIDQTSSLTFVGRTWLRQQTALQRLKVTRCLPGWFVRTCVADLLKISQGIEESKTLFALDLKIRSFSVFGKHPSIVVNWNYSYNTFS